MQDSEKINIILNGRNISGSTGQTILDLAGSSGIVIPTLCNDPRLDPFSSCYVCVVEVEGMRGLQPACSTKVTEGMAIHTDNEKVRKARKTALELIASNHYADCVAPCKLTCPAGVDVQGYISLIEKGLHTEAVALIKEVNPLSAICGRVCVRPCEAACRRNLLDEGNAVGIDYLKRFASDREMASGLRYLPSVAEPTGKKVAIIGAGPGGLTAAWFLQQKGYQCDIFEASPHAGGWLRYGIPEYRLPNDILLKEIESITDLGVNIWFNRRLGADLSYSEIKAGYDAVILTIGSQQGTLLGCKGEDAEGVYSGIDFLRNMEITGQRYNFKGKKIAVVGGGNTAMDCCRTSLRCGAEKVYVLYRRTEMEMPANPIEIHESKIEGAEYMFLTNPIRVNKNENGAVCSVTCVRMELGEPDASGRRRPVPVEGSEFDIGLDYILAAIGQSTEVDFLDDINTNSGSGKLEVNRWGDIVADKLTLQTGIDNVFAAGDGVSGPATIIEAVAQAGIASRSCHQYLSGMKPEPEKAEFLSKKENFRPFTADLLADRYREQFRQEMPVLDPELRDNFEEVELGYENAEVAVSETSRCLECGCSELYTCDLKKLSTEYGAEQKKFKGNFSAYEPDHSHPFIEIDNNKCILCARCVRICDEIVGANALGLVNRGFDTYVAPAMGDSLLHTRCESCGMCISACPTGAITENVAFKPAPVKWDTMTTICNYCSVGCAVNIHHMGNFVLRVTGKEGLINREGNICRYARFGYQYLNDKQRITRPLLKVNGEFVEISFSEAFELIREKISSVSRRQNAFYGGARLSNEELYLIQKLARAGAGTGNINSFHYLSRGEGYRYNSVSGILPDQLKGASKIYLLGSEINNDNAVTGYTINKLRNTEGIPVEIITTKEASSAEHNADRVWRVKSYYSFIKALNHFYLDHKLENRMFIAGNVSGFEKYRESILAENFDDLLEASDFGSKEKFEEFALQFNNEMNAVIIFSEKEVSSNTSLELINLSVITGKAGKTSMGLIALKEKNNSSGLFDMGIFPGILPGGVSADNINMTVHLRELWEIDDLPEDTGKDHFDMLEEGEIKNMFIFGEDPLGCATNRQMAGRWFEKTGFIMVQEYSLSETAAAADLVLPSSLPVETGGSYSNASRVIQQFDKQIEPGIEFSGLQQLLMLLKIMGVGDKMSMEDVRMEIFSVLAHVDMDRSHYLRVTGEDNARRLFNHGCDHLVKRFDDQFEDSLNPETKV